MQSRMGGFPPTDRRRGFYLCGCDSEPTIMWRGAFPTSGNTGWLETSGIVKTGRSTWRTANSY
jgi:hypothetical protein